MNSNLEKCKSGKTLFLCSGNPSRGDDGLGIKFSDAIIEQTLTRQGLDGVTVEARFQLGLEDAATIAEYENAIFVDASVSAPEPFCFCSITAPILKYSFTSHVVTPETIVALALAAFDAKTNAYVLAIRGYVFDAFSEVISTKAMDNLWAALDYVTVLLCSKKMEERIPDSHGPEISGILF